MFTKDIKDFDLVTTTVRFRHLTVIMTSTACKIVWSFLHIMRSVGVWMCEMRKTLTALNVPFARGTTKAAAAGSVLERGRSVSLLAPLHRDEEVGSFGCVHDARLYGDHNHVVRADPGRRLVWVCRHLLS